MTLFNQFRIIQFIHRSELNTKDSDFQNRFLINKNNV